MNALVTGACGQDGHYLLNELVAHDYEVFALYRGQDEERLARMKTTHPRVRWIRGDVTDSASMVAAVRSSQPDAVFNLAALSFVGLSWEMPHLYMETNAGGLLNVLEAVRTVKPDAHVVQASTSEMYGNEPVPPAGFTERSQMVPASPYGVSKLAAHRMCQVYRESYGMRVSAAISFNHESPLRPPIFVTRKIVQGAVAIARGERSTLRLGNLDAERDWGFAGDYVKAYRLMAEQSEGDDYVVATGETRTVRDWVQFVFHALRLYQWDTYIEIDKQALRPNDVRSLKGDRSKIEAKLGWEPKTNVANLAAMMVKAEVAQPEVEVVPV